MFVKFAVWPAEKVTE